MAGSVDISSASLYTDFGGLAKLRAMASARAASSASQANADRNKAVNEVARQFEALLLQSMLKAMRDASQLSESTDSDQTRFYQEMFDKQIALELATKGEGTGLATMLERDLSAKPDPLYTLQQQFALLDKTHAPRPTRELE